MHKATKEAKEILTNFYGEESDANALGKVVLSPLIIFVASLWFVTGILFTKGESK